jgi:hypothetical protein
MDVGEELHLASFGTRTSTFEGVNPLRVNSALGVRRDY